MGLLVAAPQLQQNGVSSLILVSEKPIGLSCAPPAFPDGTTLSPVNATAATFLIYRKLFGGTQEIWDPQGKNWVAPSPTITPQKLFWNDQLKAWQSIIVAIGVSDGAGLPIFGSDPATGFPKYMSQCSFSGKDSSGTQQDGQSPFSTPVMIFAPGQNNLAGLSMDPNDPTAAKEIELYLKDSSLVEQGRVVIFHDGAGFHVQLNAGSASVVISDTGQIVLTPANSQSVQVNGDIAVSGRVLIAGIQVVAP